MLPTRTMGIGQEILVVGANQVSPPDFIKDRLPSTEFVRLLPAQPLKHLEELTKLASS